jgi:hypothetical protein
MPTKSMNMINHRPTFNLLAAIINSAVKDFNVGGKPQRQSAAAFFRSERCAWMLKAVNATVSDLVENRLNGNPFDLDSLKSKKHKMKAYKPGKNIKWDGREMTVAEWAG